MTPTSSAYAVLWLLFPAVGCASATAPDPAAESSAAATTAAPREVALFAGDGAGPEYVAAVRDVVDADPRLSLTTFRDGSVSFERFDVVVFPGGTASAEWRALGPAGQAKLRAFVAAGGGYVGVCAGFYMALADVAGFVPADIHEPWARGEGTVAVKIPAHGPVFTEGGDHALRYVNGPVIRPLSAQPGYTVLATFEGNIGGSGMVTMIGKPAAVATTYGRGRAVVFSPHPELSGRGSLLVDAILWASRR